MQIVSNAGTAQSSFGRVEQHLQEAQELLGEQQALVVRLERAGRVREAQEARVILVTIERSLELAREELRMEHQILYAH
ncbi:MAG TPA: hypothetical protein VNS22_12950 [Geminicoccus sp.]|uniref:hypothetical protein n=1 Tax=Geminicoccus sp. TaxID=2024832 RepID=UPI002CF2D6D8|nr:hypothetical protein [Geminicoccus sp.]HWL69281.1 hypothetical protein [Geminicoccus sp.]